MTDPGVSQPMVVDLTADSSSESSSGQNTLQVVWETTPVEKRPRLQDNLPPVTFADLSSTPKQSQMDTIVSSPLITQSVNPTVVNARSDIFLPADVSSEGFVQPAQHVPSELYSSYPLLSLPAQPVVNDSEAVRTSSRSKKATQFFGIRYGTPLKLWKRIHYWGRRLVIFPLRAFYRPRIHLDDLVFVTDHNWFRRRCHSPQ